MRLFVAAYPPPEVVRGMLAALKRLELPPHRLVPPEQVHLTLQFIGDTAPGRLDTVHESVERATGGLRAFDLTPRRLVRLPERGRARLVAVETDAPATLLELQRRLATRLARRTRHNPADRFRPHLTLCRFRQPSPLHEVDVAVDVEGFTVDRILLMKSTLHSTGAQHVEVAQFVLT